MTDAILEAASQAMMVVDWNHKYGPTPEWKNYCRDYPDDAETYRTLARAATPLIRAAALEEAAQVALEAGSDFDTCNEIAAAIRALKEQP